MPISLGAPAGWVRSVGALPGSVGVPQMLVVAVIFKDFAVGGKCPN